MRIHGSIGDRAGLGALKQALDAYALRHRAIAANIANAETPGYRPRRVEFESILRSARDGAPAVRGATTDPRHIPLGAPAPADVEPRETIDAASEGVDVEREMVDMVKNQLAYRLAVRLLDMKYNQLHAAIRGSSR